jgi:hypothetical protein
VDVPISFARAILQECSHPGESFAFELEMFAAALSTADKTGTIQVPAHLSFVKQAAPP